MFNSIYKNKKVLVTGHTGFKGSWLTTWLLKLEANVIGISKDIPTHPSMFEELNLEEKIKHYQEDIRNLSKMSEIILDENDRIAAFVNSVCRGTTETFMAPDDPDLPFQDIFELQVYGDMPVTLVTAFTQSETRLSKSDVYSTSNRNLNQFNVYRNSELVGQSITDFYYMDETTEAGQDYCYQIMLLDDEGNELLESMEQCIAIEASYIAGDLNQDNIINVQDIILLINEILEL